MTYHWGYNKINTTGVTSGAEIHVVEIGQESPVTVNDIIWGYSKSNMTGVTNGAEIHIVLVGQGITCNS